MNFLSTVLAGVRPVRQYTLCGFANFPHGTSWRICVTENAVRGVASLQHASPETSNKRRNSCPLGSSDGALGFRMLVQSCLAKIPDDAI